MQEINPDEAYENLRADRAKRRKVKVDDNVVLGNRKKRARITTAAFLEAAKKAIYCRVD